MKATASLFANDDKTDMTTVVGSGAVSVITEVTDGKLSFGVELKNYQSNDCKFDHFTLEYLGNPTGIREIGYDVLKKENTVYDLLGRKIVNRGLLKGLYIIDGKKVLVK